MGFKYICAFLLLVVCMSLSASAQQTSNSAATGKLRGKIMDYPGVYIPDARIIIEGKRFKRRLSSADDGTYSIDAPAGTYKVRVEYVGFHPSRVRGVVITSNGVTMLNIVLYPIVKP